MDDGCERLNIRSIVKEELLKTFGQEIIYAKDCQILSAFNPAKNQSPD